MPALHLARLDLGAGTIVADQQLQVRNAMVAVIAAIGGESRKLSRRQLRVSVLDNSSAGRQLRRRREQLSGRWQGPLAVPPGSVMLCIGLGSIADELATELLVRILRDQKVDARHLSLEDLSAVPPADASPASISMAYIVSAFPSEERARGRSVIDELRRRFPQICIATVFLPGMLLQAESMARSTPKADKAATSFVQAEQICLDWHEQRAKI